MRWPFVSRRRYIKDLGAADDATDFWRNAYKGEHEENQELQAELYKLQKILSACADEKTQDAKARRVEFVVRAIEQGIRDTGFMSPLRVMPDGRISVSNTVETGRLDGQTPDRGAASGRGR